MEISPIDGTDGADDPVISPDGKLVAFIAGQKLKTVSVAGGNPTVMCDSPADRGNRLVSRRPHFFLTELRHGPDADPGGRTARRPL